MTDLQPLSDEEIAEIEELTRSTGKDASEVITLGLIATIKARTQERDEAQRERINSTDRKLGAAMEAFQFVVRQRDEAVALLQEARGWAKTGIDEWGDGDKLLERIDIFLHGLEKS